MIDQRPAAPAGPLFPCKLRLPRGNIKGSEEGRGAESQRVGPGIDLAGPFLPLALLEACVSSVSIANNVIPKTWVCIKEKVQRSGGQEHVCFGDVTRQEKGNGTRNLF